ncbi:hypothetical protein KIM67_05805 [Flagellimonas sp. 389]|uniref:hypothetical protein n=1 Tax=Flagellimonas sp. 389 TaxID=2835862 RepID=UPI001BD59D41|nr:hypothetical protein [Flagellimonas sp. 389]MBS9461918.1 hypothetical protein [Flagellimonas sp. 389]
MRFFKVKTINWKYILGEIFLIFVGINLAIWFNDWNASKTIQNDKEIALTKIKGELEANLEELVVNRNLNQKIPSFFAEMDSLKMDNKNLLLVPSVMYELRKRYPSQIRGVDSVKTDDELYEYHVDAFINLEITDLSSIAWDVAKSTGIFHEFGYDCLYGLQGLYNTQDLVKIELENATNALRSGSMQEFLRVLEFMVQIENQLEDQYQKMIESIDNCK